MMDADAAERVLFGEALCCEEVLPVGFVPGAAARSGAGTHAASATGLLNTLAQLDERGVREGDDHALAPELARLEAKLDLLLGIAGELARRAAGAPAPAPMAWSRNGARVALDHAPEPGTEGALRIQPDARIPQWIELPARVVAARPGTPAATLWCRFEGLDPGLEDALERHLFAQHRRRIARVRQVRA